MAYCPRSAITLCEGRREGQFRARRLLYARVKNFFCSFVAEARFPPSLASAKVINISSLSFASFLRAFLLYLYRHKEAFSCNFFLPPARAAISLLTREAAASSSAPAFLVLFFPFASFLRRTLGERRAEKTFLLRFESSWNRQRCLWHRCAVILIDYDAVEWMKSGRKSL